MTDSDEIAAALGGGLWTTDSFVPEYRVGEIGAWRIQPGGQLGHDWGYFTGPCLLEMLPSLHRRVEDGDGWELWMSLTPHEIESQELGYRHAVGHTVVMGLGMGWVAANVALNPRVERVTVVERDADVVRLFDESGAFASIPEAAREKITIVEDDALEWRPEAGESVDFLYADIWLGLAEESTMRDVRRMVENVRAGTIYFWGQELAIHTAMGSEGDDVTAEAVRRAIEDGIRLPLLVPDDGDYPGMIAAAVRNRTERGLPVEFPGI